MKILQGDCLELMKDIPDKSIDMVLCDLPYGTTACRWDTIIPFEPLWAHYKRIIKEGGAIVLTASQPFTSALVMSNPSWFKYEWIWEKSKATGYLNAKKMPLMASESVLVFYKSPPTYNPQKTPGKPYNKGTAHRPTNVYGAQKETEVKNDTGDRYPRNIIYFRTAESEGKLHPTQKPVSLFEYLIRTYTNQGDTVLDNCAGSGTTGIAARNLKRNFILIEKDPEYCEIAKKRLELARK